MLIGIMFIAAYSFLSKPNTPDRLYFEPDKSGQLRQTERSTPVVAAKVPLWKPEPQILLSHSKNLKLTERQHKELEVIANEWLKEKAGLESQIADAASKVEVQERTKISLAAINVNLSGYSELSRTYNEVRNKYWTFATTILSKYQRALLESTLQTEKGAKR